MYSLVSEFFHSMWCFWDLSGLLGAWVVHLFLLMSSIPPYEYTTIRLSIFWTSLFFLVTSLAPELEQIFFVWLVLLNHYGLFSLDVLYAHLG